MDTIFRGMVQCMNEKRWVDFPKYFSSPYAKNGQQFTAETHAAQLQTVGDFELTVDAITVDGVSQQCVAANVIAKFHPSKDFLGKEPEGKVLVFSEQSFNWYTGNKLSKTLLLADHDAMQRQLSETSQPGHIADLISAHRGIGKKKVPARELEQIYRAYIGCINAQTMTTDLPRFCHSQVVHNAKTLSTDEYRLLIEEAFDAVPDITFDLAIVVADEETQRVAARIEFTGTPVGVMAGAVPNGQSVKFCEHVTYAFDDGKIARVWSLVDWTSYRQQLLGGSQRTEDA
ncbi:SnoaL-domain-containing protein [Xylariaceae sp. FL0016]|nr:SnoaL-domain-containing protein [Xylariaceae sp. FL0016]